MTVAIRDVLAQNRSLDNDYGDTHGANSPDSHELTLWFGDPLITDADVDDLADVIPGVEADSTDYPGYAPELIANDATWPDADGGAKTVTVTMAAPTGEWLTQVDHWALRDPDTGEVWDTGAIAPPLVITSASDDGPVLTVTIFHPDALTDSDL